jgi:hypothetical protein
LENEEGVTSAEEKSEGIDGEVVKTFVIEEVKVGGLPLEPEIGFIKKKVGIQIDEIGIGKGIEKRGRSGKKEDGKKRKSRGPKG